MSGEPVLARCQHCGHMHQVELLEQCPLKPSSIVLMDREEHIKELENLIRYWQKAMINRVPASWNGYPEFVEIQRHLKQLGLKGETFTHHGQTEPLTALDTETSREN